MRHDPRAGFMGAAFPPHPRVRDGLELAEARVAHL
jgi:hypothetical protein